VTDFGLARIGDQGSQTRKGEVMGTPAYMAPEQARGEVTTVGPLSDVYSLGVILFQLLTNRVPYTGSVYEVMYQHCHAAPRPPSAVVPGLDPRVDALCLTAMAKLPTDRFPSAKDFAAALTNYLRAGETGTPGGSARGGYAEWLAKNPQPAAAGGSAAPEVTPLREVFQLDSDPPPAAPPRPSERSRTAAETRAGSGTLRTVPPDPPGWADILEPVDPEPTAPRPASRPPARRVRPYQWALLGLGAFVLVAGAAFGVRAMLGTKPKADAEAPPPGPARLGQGVADPRGNAFHAGDVYALRYGDPAVEMRFRWVPPGQFTRGSATGGHSDEQPVRPVTITRGFWLAETECTQDQWQALRKADPNPSTFTGPNRPVERVSATEADDFCATLARLTGRPVRLPTEAEWEYACRAGTKTDYAFGDTLATTQANFDGTKSGGGAGEQFRNRTTDAGSFPANAWGLRDMHGNVWEWCQDGYDADFYARAPSLDPVCTDNQGKQRVLRGGSWYDRASYCRSAYRSRFSPGGRDSSYGFRACFRPD
jgi:formylglycine-generating enzyme required for sulfatase activity